MSDIFRLLSGIMAGGPLETVGRDEVNGLIVSTVLTVDQGYETAVIDDSATHPVQRYQNCDAAKSGHAYWIEQAKTIATVTKLGYGSLINDEIVTLVRSPARPDERR